MGRNGEYKLPSLSFKKNPLKKLHKQHVFMAEMIEIQLLKILK